MLAPTPNSWPMFNAEIKNPQGQSLICADPRALRALVALMDMHAQIGGAASHFGGPSALAEIVSALHALIFSESKNKNQQWYELFNVVNDAGHCENILYALKAVYSFGDLKLEDLKKFRSIESPLTGHGEAHIFPQGVLVSNGPLGSALAQAQGLAMADKKSGLDRVTTCLISDGACMEGEAKEALSSIPGLAKKGLLNPFILIISDNNTKLSGRISEDTFSMEGVFASLAPMGWRVIPLDDGHSLEKCIASLQQAFRLASLQPEIPVAIRAKTIKGFGSKSCVESANGGHGFPLKKAAELNTFLQEIYQTPGPTQNQIPELFLNWIEELKSVETAKAEQKQSTSSVCTNSWTAKLKNVPREKIQLGISAALIEARSQGLPIISITSDLPGSTGLASFRKKFPEESFDMGVAEANMISVAAGFSKAGYIPIVDTFAQFGVTKGSLPLIMANLSLAPMICIFSHTGFQDAADGASHQALSYLAMTMSLPHTQVFCLSCSSEAHNLLRAAIIEFSEALKKGKTPDSYIFFLGREDFPQSYSDQPSSLSRGQMLSRQVLKGKNVVLASSGSLVPEALRAADALVDYQIGSIVLNLPNVKQPDLELVHQSLAESEGYLFYLEDHQKIGGAGQRLFAALIEERVSFCGHIFGVNDEFGRSSYTASELYRLHGLDGLSVAQKIAHLLKGIQMKGAQRI